MRLVSSTTNPKLKLGFLLLLGSFSAAAQENSPFSRFGLGDILQSQNIVNKGMGGLSSPYLDGSSINFYNPASYSGHKIVTFDVGVRVDNRNLKSAAPLAKYSSTNFLPSYVAVGMPINKARNLGLAFGLRPVSSINYSIEQRTRTSVDSIGTLYEGTGGLYQLYGGIGKRWGGLRIGFNGGYTFGRKELNTRVVILNDSVSHAQTNSATITTFGKGFIDGGLQYEFRLGKNSMMRLGFNANLKRKLNANQDLVRETFQYDASGGTVRIDSVFESKEREGTIELPATYTAGILYQNMAVDRLGNRLERFSIGAEYESSKWSEYRFYDQPDNLANTWQLRVGAQLTPNPLSVESYWNRVSYRAGFYTGKDAVIADGKELPNKAITFGAGFPVRKWRSFDNQYTIINTSIEVGKRGNNDNNITENYFRLSFGLSLSDIWFIKRRYD